MRICNCFELLREMKDSREKLQHFHLTLIAKVRDAIVFGCGGK